MGSKVQSKCWCFTLNNPVDGEMEAIIAGSSRGTAQREIGEAGTPHWQGYCEFPGNKTLPGVKSLCSRAHWEKRSGTRAEAVAYCTKEASRDPAFQPRAWGEPFTADNVGSKSGARTDLVEARDLLRGKRTMAEAMDDDRCVDIIAKYPRFAELCLGTRRPAAMAEPVFRPWQQALVTLLDGTPDQRKIHWFVDPVGASGKSFCTRYLVCNKGAVMLIGKRADCYYAYDGQPIVIMDFARQQHDQVDYVAMEQIKNGLVFSSKYTSGMKVFTPPHMVVFSNFEPNREMLSMDRWDVTLLNPLAIPPARVPHYIPNETLPSTVTYVEVSESEDDIIT